VNRDGGKSPKQATINIFTAGYFLAFFFRTALDRQIPSEGQ
jgi:hypothetical protein